MIMRCFSCLVCFITIPVFLLALLHNRVVGEADTPGRAVLRYFTRLPLVWHFGQGAARDFKGETRLGRFGQNSGLSGLTEPLRLNHRQVPGWQFHIK
ncbi:hypothetical protein F5Y05DRAFT_303041 [Hypoxylon sp. FL0543]|nr:hypothetical protein F5Y05DRAFT_303041 [Hypoxylon sp. FL0543]